MTTQPESRKLHHQSIADQTTALLRSMILCGEIRPGERVTQYQLSSMLGVSTMPVREGLLRLAVEGIIEALPNRSFTVVSMSQDDIRDMYWHQGALTGELARRACRSGNQALLDELRSCHESFEEAFRDDDLNQMSILNWQFHRAINMAVAPPDWCSFSGRRSGTSPASCTPGSTNGLPKRCADIGNCWSGSSRVTRKGSPSTPPRTSTLPGNC